ncbi:MAG: hypothetical protein HQL32_03220 [Planctomycetes bacterium]|nr:hypothetical protein [Planctomycetota bacterium]
MITIKQGIVISGILGLLGICGCQTPTHRLQKNNQHPLGNIYFHIGLPEGCKLIQQMEVSMQTGESQYFRVVTQKKSSNTLRCAMINLQGVKLLDITIKETGEYENHNLMLANNPQIDFFAGNMALFLRNLFLQPQSFPTPLFAQLPEKASSKSNQTKHEFAWWSNFQLDGPIKRIYSLKQNPNPVMIIKERKAGTRKPQSLATLSSFVKKQENYIPSKIVLTYPTSGIRIDISTDKVK